MRDVFNEQLHELMTQLQLMGAKADEMIGLAVRSLVEQNESLAHDVYSRERQVNELQMEIDRRAVSITAQHQPVASDLRLVFAATKIATDVERIADQAVNICQSAHFVLQFPPCDPMTRVQELAVFVRKMVADGMVAVSCGDCQLAEAILAEDVRADLLRDEIFRALLTCMITDPLTSQRSMSLVLIARNLERIGDHAANIAEEVIYIVRGEDVRHRYDRPVRKPGGGGGENNTRGQYNDSGGVPPSRQSPVKGDN
ncbi:MAG: phosphate signaling complex protein PhoU [Thermoguttaceae bacterium]